MSMRERYFASATSWADGQAAAVLRAQRRAWAAAAGFALLSLLLGAALLVLLPLKRSEPWVVMVDRATGTMSEPVRLKEGGLTENEAVIEAELARYVRARESFDQTDLQENYRQVQLRSAPDARAAYVQWMAPSNPDSPLRSLGRGDFLQTNIRSVSLLGPGTALVRFDAVRTTADGRALGIRSYASAISFGFNGRPLAEQDRFENPLGFQVTRYRRDVEGSGR